MAIAAAMNTTTRSNNNDNNNNNNKQDDHELYDMVMPGFRFHPTEEELVEFYLRRKVEGKQFNVDLITFLDLYRYDPWELPALAAIGEKEWYFYVPRDKKYRNGDRPNRVTTSGYWKATGADRMIRSENLRSIGLKKTLVFYSGKAPKGIRTSWIMNEYRLPLHETERLQKAEISLCRVYKRAGVEDHPGLPRSLPVRASRGRNAVPAQQAAIQAGLFGGSSTSPSSSTDISAGKQQSPNFTSLNPLIPIITPVEHEDQTMIFLHSKQAMVSNSSHNPPNCNLFIAAGPPNNVDDLHKLVNINSYTSHQIAPPSSSSTLLSQHQYANNVTQPGLLPHGFSASLQPQPGVPAAAPPPFNIAGFHAAVPWDWNSMSEASKDFTNLFK